MVLGGGLAGLTAGLFAARCGRSTLVLEASIPGGHLANVETIEDFPGFGDGVAGYDLCPVAQEQAANAGAEFELAEVQAVRAQGPHWSVETSEGRHQAKVVIVAVGSHPRSLDIPGEARLLGRGVSHCATCDGPLFRGKAVGVVGGGDSALQEALTLAKFAARVTVFHRGTALSAQHTYQARALEQSAIEVRYGTVVDEILGEETVAAVRVRDVATLAQSDVALNGLFPYVGLAPSTAFLEGVVPLDAAGHIRTDCSMRTDVPGVFAAGDVRQDSACQAIASAGDGATAALAAHRYIAERF